MYLIVNADDLGMNASTNQAIQEAFRKRFCSSATLMANMPGFEEACEIIRRERLAGHVGLHLVLKDGFPLTAAIRKLPRFCDAEGKLCFARQGPVPVFHLSGAEKQALAEEIRAQIKHCRSRGIDLTHIDSHYDLHVEWAVAVVLLAVMREQKIPYVRLSRNCGEGLGPAKRLYKTLFNHWLARSGVARTRFFGSIEDYKALVKNVRMAGRVPSEAIGSCEVMVHPGFSKERVLLDFSTQKPLQTAIAAVAGYRQAVSYTGLRLSNG